MLTLICQKCNKEFKVSGADFEERKGDGSLALCPMCTEAKKKEKPVKVTLKPIKPKKDSGTKSETKKVDKQNKGKF